MKRWKSLLTAASVVSTAALLVGCGSLTGDNAKSKNSKDGSKTLVMYQIGDAPKNIDKLMENANKIIEKKIGMKLEMRYIGWGDYAEKMSVMTSAGDEYDIAYAQDYVLNAQKGAYADLTDLYQTVGKKLYDALDPAYIKGNTVNGKIYAVPVYGNVTNQQMLSFNGELLKKYNLDVSKVNSYEDLEPLLQVIKEKEKEVTPFAIGKQFTLSDDFEYPATNSMPFVVDLQGDTTKIVNRYDVERYRKHLRTIRDYYQKGYIAADAATSDTAYQLTDNTWFVREETQGPADFGDSLLTTVAQKPIISRPITKAYKKNTSTQVANFVISQTSKNKEKAMEFLTLLNTDPELLNGLVFGPEGENWEKDKSDDKRIKLLPGYDKPGTHMSAWNTGNYNILYITDRVTDKDVAQAEKVKSESKESPALGFTFNTENVKSEMTSISNIMAQYMPSLNTGTVDPDKTIDEMMNKLKTEGSYDKVLKEVQKQYDEFLSKNK